MKILIIDNDVINEFEGGLYIYKTTGNFGLELIEKGHEVEFFQTKICRNSPFHSFNLNKNNFTVTTSRRYTNKLLTYLVAYLKVFKRLKSADFLYIYYPTNYHYLCFLALILRRKFGINVRGQESFTSSLSKYLFRKAHVVCTVSDYFTNAINVMGGNAFTQRPMLNEIFFIDNQLRKYDIRVTYKILFVGRLDLEKGIIELLDAVYELKKRGYSINVNLVGDGQDYDIVVGKIKSLQLNDVVKLIGAVHDQNILKQLYNDADIFVLPSYHEGFPRVVYEAMLSRIPIITTIVGGMSVLMEDGYNCIEIKPRSTDDLIEKLEYLIKNYSLSILLCENAFFSVIDFFNFATMKQSEIVNNSLSSSLK